MTKQNLRTQTGYGWLECAAMATAVLGTSALLGACTQRPATREWTPADHSQQPDSELDPARIPEAPSGDTIARAAAALYRVSCASCHGEGGRGDGPDKPPGATVPDMTTAEWQASRSDAEIAAALQNGKGLMPKFGDKVNPQGIAALVTHVRSLGN